MSLVLVAAAASLGVGGLSLVRSYALAAAVLVVTGMAQIVFTSSVNRRRRPHRGPGPRVDLAPAPSRTGRVTARRTQVLVGGRRRARLSSAVPERPGQGGS